MLKGKKKASSKQITSKKKRKLIHRKQSKTSRTKCTKQEYKAHFRYNYTPPGNPGQDRRFKCQLRSERCSFVYPATYRRVAFRGNRCRRRTSRTVEYCWSHIRNQLFIDTTQQSQIANAGRGLFGRSNDANIRAERINIAAAGNWQPPGAGRTAAWGRANARFRLYTVGDTIGYYLGLNQTRRQIDARYGNGTAPYAFGLGSTQRIRRRARRFVDSACFRGFGSQINHVPEDDVRRNIWFDINSGGYPRRQDYRDLIPNHFINSIRNGTYRVVRMECIRSIYDGDELFASYGDDYLLVGGNYVHNTR